MLVSRAAVVASALMPVSAIQIGRLVRARTSATVWPNTDWKVSESERR